MSLHGDLLEQAGRLARQEPRKPKQASLRRAVSAAYYALFHLLINEATRLFLSGVQREALRLRLARAFRHSAMKHVSQVFAKDQIPRKLHLGGYAFPLQPELRFVAGAFCDLQDARHDADYTWRGASLAIT